MSKKIGLVVALVGMCALSVFLLNCGSSSSRPAGVLYVLTQGTTVEGSPGVGNNVSSFTIDLDSGALSLVNSNASTCPTAASQTNPEPCGLPLDILLDPTGATAFVLNQGIPSATPTDAIAPTIYPYTVNSDGSLSAPGTPASGWNCVYPNGSSCGAAAPYELYYDTPLAMVRDAAGQFLFVIDQGQFPGKTTCPLVGAAANSLTDANNFVGCPSISVFAVSPGSTTLTFVSQSSTYQSPFFIGRIPTGFSALTFPAPGSGTTPACGFTSSEEFLFVTSNQDLSDQHNDNALSLYCVSSTGSLTDMTPDPPYTPAVDPLSVQAINTTPSGNSGNVYIYVGSQPSSAGALTIFQLCTVVGGLAGCTQPDVTNALLLPIVTPAPPATGENPVAMLVDPTNNFLYVACYVSNQVFAYRINASSGALTTLAPPSQPTGSEPVSMAMHASVNSIGQSLYNFQSGQFLYTSNSNSDNITGFTLSTTSGAMLGPTTTVSPAAPSGMAAH
jgi:hypothetical protein